VIGESSRPGDMEVNAVKGKKLTNVRSVVADEKSNLPPPRKMTLEDYIIYMDQDEVLEITPNAIRLRKKFLDAGERQRAQKKMSQKRELLKK
jgi:GTP-binding protein